MPDAKMEEALRQRHHNHPESAPPQSNSNGNVRTKPVPCQSATSPRATRKWWFMTICALVITAYSLNFLFGPPLVDAEVQSRLLASPSGWCHVGGGLTALATGPFQLHHRLRNTRLKAHRVAGRVYALAVVVSGISAFYLSFHLFAYPIGQYGFAILALLWLLSCGMAIKSIKQGDRAKHREWMIRNYALTFAAVMQRWQIPLYLSFGLAPPAALSITGFSCWVPNSLFAEWWLRW